MVQLQCHQQSMKNRKYQLVLSSLRYVPYLTRQVYQTEESSREGFLELLYQVL